MNKEFKIYHTETQEDYDDLMIRLEDDGYVWASGDKPTSGDYWSMCGRDTIVYLGSWGEDTITRSNLSGAKKNYPTIPIVKHKAKGVEQMEKVVVPQFVADWYEEYGAESLYITLDYFLNGGVGSTEELEKWGETCEGESAYPKVNAEKKIAKMHLYGYEVEEKKYYWRKKKEHLFDLDSSIYINVTKYGRVFFSDEIVDDVEFKTKFTETEIKKLVSEEDFSKLEKVEIEDV